jgi:hypothetical protein
MATINNTVHVLGMISPTDTRDSYATHEDIYGKGGYRIIDLLEDLIKIPSERRKEGMIAFVLETQQYFQLLGGILDEHWVIANFGGGSGSEGDVNYIRITPIPTTVGGATAGTTFNGTVQDALDKILYPYIAPSFSSFTVNVNTIYEVGTFIPENPRDFTWNYSNQNITPDTITIYDHDNTALLSFGSLSPNSFTGTGKELNFNSMKTYTYKIQAKNSKGAVFERMYTTKSLFKIYYGNGGAELTEAQVKSLTSSALESTLIGKTLTAPAVDYKWFCIPTSYPTPSKWIDNNTGFAVAMNDPIQVSITNANNFTTMYNCFRTTNQLGQALTVKIS